jgi:hypothetical protein
MRWRFRAREVIDTSMILLPQGLGRTTQLAFRDQRGFALVLVIAVLGVLALLAAAIAAETRSTALGARSRLEIVAARDVADSGVTLTIVHLLDRNNASRWQTDGSVHEERYGTATLRISVEDEGGKIDLNDASKELIAGLLGEFVGAEQSGALANAIIDRRTESASTFPSTARYFVGGSANFQALALLRGCPLSSAGARNSKAAIRRPAPPKNPIRDWLAAAPKAVPRGAMAGSCRPTSVRAHWIDR